MALGNWAAVIAKEVTNVDAWPSKVKDPLKYLSIRASHYMNVSFRGYLGYLFGVVLKGNQKEPMLGVPLF